MAYFKKLSSVENGLDPLNKSKRGLIKWGPSTSKVVAYRSKVDPIDFWSPPRPLLSLGYPL